MMVAVPPAIDALFLSPHFDDVAFSCAGALADHLREGDRTLVVTVFGGAPSSELPILPLQRELLKKESVCAADLHTLWRLRVAEDVAAMAVLKSAHRHLAFADAAFRREIESWRQIWSPPAAESAPLAESISREVETLWRSIGRPLVYAPLAVGGHLDHRLCFDAATSLERAGADVSYYEDFPYAARPGKLEERLVELGPGWRYRLLDVTRDMPLRVEASSCYRSQLPGIFGPMSDDEIAQPLDRVTPILVAFARSRSETPDTCAERLWLRAT